MHKYHLLLYILAAWLLSACSKDNTKPVLPAGSVSIQGISAKDTLVREVGIIKDTFLIIGLQAVLDGPVAGSDHIVKFRADTTLLNAYRIKYGDATLLPIPNYLFYRNVCRIPAGASISDSVQLNLVLQTGLKPETVYVLPVDIQNVDGNTDAVAPGQVLYLVVKTGKSPTISKEGWSIVSASSNAADAAAWLLDTDTQTGWTTAYGSPMPQNVVIDFGSLITFSGVSYSTSAIYYTIMAAYPTKVKVEVSTDNITWTDKGTYAGVTTPVPWVQNVGLTTARYLRFTVLEVPPAALSFAVVSDINLIP